MHDEQYKVIAARRQGYDNLLWQVPSLGVAAQGILVSIAANKDSSSLIAAVSLFCAAIVGVSVIFLFKKLRFREVSDSEILAKFEENNSTSGFSILHGRRSRGISAYIIWISTLSLFLIIEVISIILVVVNWYGMSRAGFSEGCFV